MKADLVEPSAKDNMCVMISRLRTARLRPTRFAPLAIENVEAGCGQKNCLRKPRGRKVRDFEEAWVRRIQRQVRETLRKPEKVEEDLEGEKSRNGEFPRSMFYELSMRKGGGRLGS